MASQVCVVGTCCLLPVELTKPSLSPKSPLMDCDHSMQVVQTYESFAQAFLSRVALALSMPANAFLCVTDSTTQGSGHVAASSLEAIQYPAPDTSIGPAAQSANCEAHVDRGLLTCIFADSVQGLQVQQECSLHQRLKIINHPISITYYRGQHFECCVG